MSSGTGTATIDFGSGHGTNVVSVTVTGQTAISGTSGVEAYMMGVDTTATHNAFEHSWVPIKLSCTAIAAGTGFTIQASSDLRLTGTFTIRWVWAD